MDSTPEERSVSTIEFHREDDGVTGEDRHGRRWHILEERSGWRLSFRDPGDASPTNAGLFGSLSAAQREVEGTGGR